MFKSLRSKHGVAPPQGSVNTSSLASPSTVIADALKQPSASTGSTRAASIDGSDTCAQKAPKVPMLSANGKKLVEQLRISHCMITSEFPLTELLANTSAVLGLDLELDAADKLQLAAADEDAVDSRDVPDERIRSRNLQPCMKKEDNSKASRRAQLRKRVCFRSELWGDEDSSSPRDDVTELHLYELVRLKHRCYPDKEARPAVNSMSSHYDRIAMIPRTL